MSAWSLRLYHRLPPVAQSLAAGWHGGRLRRWRYGPETERLIEDALARETWSAEAWKRWRDERLAYVLHRAATRVPYYRDTWADRRRGGDRSSWELLENWPILSKATVRDAPRRFVADDCDIRRMFHEHTSGTSGTPLDLWWSRETVRGWYALFEARWRRWYGVSRHDRWGILGGQLVTSFAKRNPPFWVWNASLNQLYLSSYHLAPDLIPAYLNALEKYRVRYLWGYTSSLHALAQEILRQGRRLPLQVVITNAEPVSAYQREVIAQAFCCPVHETYGMSEIVAAASECQEGSLHWWPEVGVTELLEREAGDDGSAPLVSTGLFNADMPLIRYRIGDRVSRPTVDVSCACGRTLPILSGIDGRDDDVLYARDGRRVGRLDPAFKAALPLREAQIVQETLDRVRVRYVPAPGFTAESGRAIVAALQARLGAVHVILESIAEIPRTSNGKFRAVVCQLSPEERAAASVP